MQAKTLDYKGKIKEVILKKENVLDGNINKGIVIIIHYIMSNDTLEHIVTEFPNLTVNETKGLVKLNRTNMSNYYFDGGYMSYCRLYIDDRGIVTTDYRKTLITQIPLGVREQLRMIAGIW